jgi:hypothetical protein
MAALVVGVWACLLVSGAGQLTTPDCLRLLGLAFAFGALAWLGGVGTLPVAAATALLAGAAQVAPLAGAPLPACLWLALGLTAWGARGPTQPLASLGLLGWAAIASAGVGLALNLAAGSLFRLQMPMVSRLQWPVYAAVWWALHQWLSGLLPGLGPGPLRRAPWPVWAVLGGLLGLAAWGGTRLLQVRWDVTAAETTARQEDPAAAAVRLQQVGVRAAALQQTTAANRATLAAARYLVAAGQVGRANALLGLAADSSRALAPTDWLGQTGAELHRNVSCWADVWLWDGPVVVELCVKAQAARQEWPKLAVTLDGQPLGQVEVHSDPETRYRLSGTAVAGLHRLEISLVNGFWTSRGEHRWARLEQVTIRSGRRQ